MSKYRTQVGGMADVIAAGQNRKLHDPLADFPRNRTIVKGGMVVDPANNIEAVKDIAIVGDSIAEVADSIAPESGDLVINAEGLLVFPGLVDMHLHIEDLFEVTTDPIGGSVADGVTVALSPGAANSICAPGLLGAEVDRGVPNNVGVYLGAANVLGCSASVDELVAYFKGELPAEIVYEKISRNPITAKTGTLSVGIKDHMAHFIQSDEAIDKTFEITSRAGLLFMSHCQDPGHSERVAALAKGRALHLGHTNAAGCGTHGDALESIQAVLELIRNNEGITGEFVTTMLRPGLGSREGLLVDPRALEETYEALRTGLVDVLVSDGQNDACLKGFGDTRDNIPCLLELVDLGVLSLSQAVATMTINPCRLFAKRSGQNWWTEKLGHLGVGALANITIVDEKDMLATYTLVNGIVAGFEDRAVREAYGAGRLVTNFGLSKRPGTGDLAMYRYNF